MLQVQQFQKREKLTELLRDVPDLSNQKTLVFVEVKKTADFLANYLSDLERDVSLT